MLPPSSDNMTRTWRRCGRTRHCGIQLCVKAGAEANVPDQVD
jgi:hypothetical protein